MDIKNENFDSSNGNNGSKGRFRERLKKISRDKRLKTKSVVEQKDNNVRKIFKSFLIISTFLHGSFRNKQQKNNKNVSQNSFDASINKNKDINNLNFLSFKKVKLFNSDVGNTKICNDEKKTINKDGLVNFDIVSNNSNYTNYNNDIVNKDLKIFDDNNVFLDKQVLVNDIKVKELQKDIINSIKLRLVKILNELEILNSEFYVLNEVINDNIYLDECREKIKEVKVLLSRIKSLKEKYDYLKNNIDFDNLLSIEDDYLIDKIIELKNVCTNDDIKNTIEDYKILEEYKSLYLKVDRLEDDVLKYSKYRDEKEKELKNRDIDFDKLKQDVYNKTYDQRDYEEFVNKQNMFIKKLDEKLMKIDSHEKTIYKLKGVNQLVGNSFKYLGLLLASPLKGIFPSISRQTVITRSIVLNLYNNMEWEKQKKMVYETIDFSWSINSAINDMEHTLNLVNITIDDIRKLKEKYSKEFSKYESSFSEYNEIIKKINKMENALLNNRVKIQLMKDRMREKEKENDNKMKMVKKLNCSSNN